MRKSIVVVFVLLCSLLLVGCGKAKKDGIVGNWESETGSYKYTFKEDGTCTQTVLSTSSDCTYDNEKIVFNQGQGVYERIVNYTLNGDTMNTEETIGGSVSKGTYYRK